MQRHGLRKKSCRPWRHPWPLRRESVQAIQTPQPPEREGHCEGEESCFSHNFHRLDNVATDVSDATVEMYEEVVEFAEDAAHSVGQAVVCQHKQQNKARSACTAFLETNAPASVSRLQRL